MTKFLSRFIEIAQIIFVIATIPVMAVALAYLWNGGSHFVGLAWIAIAMGCLGNITNWRRP